MPEVNNGDFSPKIRNLIRIFYKPDGNRPATLQDAIDAFAIAIKERFSARKLVINYFEGYSYRDSYLLYLMGIDLKDDIREQLAERDKREYSQSPWEYVQLYSWFKNVWMRDIRHNGISYFARKMGVNQIDMLLLVSVVKGCKP